MFWKIPHCNHKHNPNNLHDHDHILNHGHHIAVIIIVIHLKNIVICCIFPSKITYIFTYTPPPLKSPNYKRHNSDTNTAKMGMKNFLFAYRKKRAVTLQNMQNVLHNFLCKVGLQIFWGDTARCSITREASTPRWPSFINHLGNKNFD